MAFVIVGFLYFERSDGIERPDLQTIPASVPNFNAYTDVKAKKRDFFAFMLPMMVRNANALVAAERKFLLAIAEVIADGKSPSSRQQQTVAMLKEKYRIDDEGTATLPQGLLERVDTIPASLVLAQAANESAWGTSRFARNGNNYFGIWCFSFGCGQIPTARDAGKSHEVASFESIQSGVEYYFYTINTHPAYQRLRDLRTEARRGNEKMSGAKLAEGLIRYSERGASYVREIQAMITINQLQHFTLDSKSG